MTSPAEDNPLSVIEKIINESQQRQGIVVDT